MPVGTANLASQLENCGKARGPDSDRDPGPARRPYFKLPLAKQTRITVMVTPPVLLVAGVVELEHQQVAHCVILVDFCVIFTITQSCKKWDFCVIYLRNLIA